MAITVVEGDGDGVFVPCGFLHLLTESVEGDNLVTAAQKPHLGLEDFWRKITEKRNSSRSDSVIAQNCKLGLLSSAQERQSSRIAGSELVIVGNCLQNSESAGLMETSCDRLTPIKAGAHVVFTRVTPGGQIRPLRLSGQSEPPGRFQRVRGATIPGPPDTTQS